MVVAACSADSEPVADATVDDAPATARDFVVIAHRGFSARAPEHTIAAYDLAAEAGADYIEQDLQLTADGVLVALHDATLDRTADGSPEFCTGPVIERTLDEIRECEVGSWFNEARPERANPSYGTARIPTLDEVFTRFGSARRYYIETKNPEEAPGMEEALLAALDRHGIAGDTGGLPNVIIQSFSRASLEKLNRLDPDLFLVQLYGRADRGELLDSLGVAAGYAEGVGPHFSAIDAEFVEAAHAAGLVVHPYTVNEIADMRRVVAAGVDGFFTDESQRALELRSELVN